MASAPCHRKVRYVTRELAEESAAEQRARRNHHPAHAVQHHAYWCYTHGCFHTGHSVGPERRHHSDSTAETIGRLRDLRAGLIADFGRTLNAESWRGVRALTGVIRYLQG